MILIYCKQNVNKQKVKKKMVDKIKFTDMPEEIQKIMTKWGYVYDEIYKDFAKSIISDAQAIIDEHVRTWGGKENIPHDDEDWVSLIYFEKQITELNNFFEGIN